MVPTAQPSFDVRRAFVLLCAAAIALLVSACGGSDSAPPPQATPASVTTQPASTTAVVGAAASFTVEAAGDGLTYKWQQSTDGGSSWADIAGATRSSYAIASTTPAQDGHRFRAIVAGATGAAITSSAATLTLTQAPSFTSSPANASISMPGAATFTVEASGLPLPAIQWQVSTDNGVTFVDIPGATSATYATGATTMLDSGRQFRAVATNPSGSANSSAGTLTVNGPSYPPLQALGELSTTSGRFLGFASANDHLYIAAEFDGILVIDTRDLMSPRQAGAVPHSTPLARDQVVAVAISSSTLIASVYPGCSGFCQPSNGELRFYDLSNPAEPRFVAALPGAANSLVVDGTTLFALGRSSDLFSPASLTLRAIDLTSPASPRVLSSLATANASSMARQGGRLFLGFSEKLGGSPGLQVIDVGDPAAPRIVDTSGSPSADPGTNDVVADAAAVFTASGTAELRTYSASVPLDGPASTSLPKPASSLALAGTLLLVSQAESGVVAYRRDAGTGISWQTVFAVDGVCLSVSALGRYGVARVAEVRTDGTFGNLVRPERLVFFALPQQGQQPADPP